ncbi:MAG: hypothetical protein IID45_01475 [Planctomycetes bacterium]|nr:hypothetical protein [Planctomycetota bacterium]
MATRVMLLLLATAAFIAVWSTDRRRSESARTARQTRDQTTAFADGAAKTHRPDNDRVPRQHHSPATIERHSPATVETGSRENRGQVETTIGIDVLFAEKSDSQPHLSGREMKTPGDRVNGSNGNGLRRRSVAARKPRSAGVAVVAERPVAEPPLPPDITPGSYRVVNSRGLSRIVHFTSADLAERGVPLTLPDQPLYQFRAVGLRWYFIRIDSRRPVAMPSITVIRPRNDAVPHSPTDLTVVTLGRRLVRSAAQSPLLFDWLRTADQLAIWSVSVRNSVLVSSQRTLKRMSQTVLETIGPLYRRAMNALPSRLSDRSLPARRL